MASEAFDPNSRDNLNGIDIRKLADQIDQIDYTVIRARRKAYNRLFWEANFLDPHNKGISFQNMLLLLSHHKLVDDEKALKYVMSQFKQSETNSYF